MRPIALRAGFTVIAMSVLDSCSPDGNGPSPGVPASIVASAGNGQVGPAGQACPESLAVIVRDAGGSPLAGVTVAWAVVSGGGAVSPATATTRADGTAKALLTLGPNAGAQSTTATVSGLPAVTFSAIAQIQGAVQMGDRSIGPLTDTVLGTLTEIEQPLKVLVLDQNGQPVQNVVVSWRATGGGAVSAAHKATDAGGESIVEYTFGAVAGGGYGAEASVPGLFGSPVVWQLTAQPGNPAGIQKSGGDGLVVQVGGQVVHTVTAHDAHGNATPGVLIQWATVTGGGSVFPAQGFTGVGGAAEATRTLGAGTGIQTASATASGLVGSPKVTFSTTAATTVIRVANNVFLPGTVTILAGDSVAWQWQTGSAAHNLTFAATAGSPANEPDRSAGAVWRTFPAAGTFNYQCTNHPGMTGTVTVQP